MISIVLTPFDYTAYRVMAYSNRRWGGDSDFSRAGMVVGVLQAWLLSNIYFGVVILTGDLSLTTPPKPYQIAALVLLGAFNFYRYWKIAPYEKLKKRWEAEKPGVKRLRFWLIILSFIFLGLLTTFIYPAIRQHLAAG